MTDIQFKDVELFSTFYQYGHKYRKESSTTCSQEAYNSYILCEPDNWVQIKE